MEEILEGVEEQEVEILRQSGAEVLGFFDFMGLLAPIQFAEQYRGRIYIFPAAISAAQLRDTYGLTAGGIDLLSRVVAHEFAHRDLFLAAWGGFSNDHIAPRGVWLPLFPENGHDDDGDSVSNTYEDADKQIYHFHRGGWDALHRWWTGQQGSIPTSGLPDPEMYSRLYGEWNGYWVGSLDSQDWSVGGRQDYEGGN
ncbi:MAG: hypothetical protein ACP5RN_06705 [Armatimonadota bacterium]